MKHISAKYFALLVIALALCGKASADPISGAPVGYGWAGLRAWTFQTSIAIGRPL